MNGKTTRRIMKNGKFYSVDINGTLTISQAVVVENGKFLYVGDNAGAERHAMENTEIIDLMGCMVIPGMSDAHIHASWKGLLDQSINLYELQYTEGFQWNDYIQAYKDIIRENISMFENAPIIRAAGFNAGFCLEGSNTPTKMDLDEISKEKPIIVRSFCYHYAWANSKALELAGITEKTPDPENGMIYRDEFGEPTGFFQEMDAINLLLEGVTDYDLNVEEYKKALKKYEHELAHQYGITMIFDALASDNAMKAYHELSRDGQLDMRVRGCRYADPERDSEQFDHLPEIQVNDKYCIDTVKFFMDGTGIAFSLNDPFEKGFLESNGLAEDYKGHSIWKGDTLKKSFLKITEAGYQIHVHCMGDGAITDTLDALEYVKETLGYLNERNVIAHIMVIKEEDKKRMAELGVIAAVMPCWMYVEDLNDTYYIPVLGRNRSIHRYPLKSLKDAGVRITAGTDFPVSLPPNPFCEIEMSMTRSIMKSDNRFEKYKDDTLGPGDGIEERFSLKEIIESLTIAAAFQHGISDIAGSIEIGKSADFVVLSQDLEEIDVLEIENVYPLITVFEGRIVYKGKEFDQIGWQK